MKLAHLASRLYPRWWRERYGAELAALIEDTRPGLWGALNIAAAAVVVQSKTWTPGRQGIVSVLAGLLMFALMDRVATLAAPRPQDPSGAEVFRQFAATIGTGVAVGTIVGLAARRWGKRTQ